MDCFIKAEVARFKVGEELWVDLKVRMNTHDHHRLQGAYLKVDVKKEEVSVADESFAHGEDVLLLINIIVWNLPDDAEGAKEGAIAPIDFDHLKRLDPKISRQIAAEIQKRNPSPKV